jgi:MFS superfamily sulfate permease-like transporter
MFFTSMAPAITFAMFLTTETKQQIGIQEVLLSTAIGGVAFSIFAGQPLVIVGVTGPIVILTISMFTLSESWGINFLAFYAWAQIWAAFMHIIIAMFNLCNLIKYVTNFSCETFGILIATIFIYEGLRGMTEYFKVEGGSEPGSEQGSVARVEPDMAAGYLQIIIAMGTIYLSLIFLNAKNWIVFHNNTRTLLSDYGITLAVCFMTLFAYMGKNRDENIEFLETPNTFGTTTQRAWAVDLTDLPIWAVFVAIFPGFIITVLFAFDHNISSLMAQAKEYGLQKGFSFHWDFLVLGLCLIITGGFV